MPRSCSRLSATAVIVAAGLAVAACGSNSSSHTAATSGTGSSLSATSTYVSSQATVIGKSTDVVINPAVLAAIEHAGITVAAVAPATATRRTLLFPVNGGQIVVTTLVGTVDLTGELTFSHSGKVTLSNFVINTNTKQLTATVGGQSMPVFDLNLASLKRASGRHGIVIASDIKLTVTSEAATALNSSLGVRTFKGGMNFGVATLTVRSARGHR